MSSSESSSDSSDSESSSGSEYENKEVKIEKKEKMEEKSNSKSPKKTPIVITKDDKEQEEGREVLLKKAVKFKKSVSEFVKVVKSRTINPPNLLTDSSFRVALSK